MCIVAEYLIDVYLTFFVLAHVLYLNVQADTYTLAASNHNAHASRNMRERLIPL
jgi:hypothetical protein